MTQASDAAASQSVGAAGREFPVGGADGSPRRDASCDGGRSDVAGSAEALLGDALRVVDLHASYGSVHALTGVTFAVEAGRVCGLVGTNGSGKSTLIKAIMGAVRSKGGIRLLGMDASAARKRGLVGYVPQNEGVDWDFPLTVDDVVAMGRYCGLGPTRRLKAEDRDAVARALRLVDLSDLRARPVGALSGGQRKRVFIARAIAQGARLFLLDEPFAGVDRPSEALITGLLRDLASKGATMFVATHDLSGLPGLCDEVLLLRRKAVFHGPVDAALDPAVLGRAFGFAPAGFGPLGRPAMPPEVRSRDSRLDEPLSQSDMSSREGSGA